MLWKNDSPTSPVSELRSSQFYSCILTTLSYWLYLLWISWNFFVTLYHCWELNQSRDFCMTQTSLIKLWYNQLTVAVQKNRYIHFGMSMVNLKFAWFHLLVVRLWLTVQFSNGIINPSLIRYCCIYISPSITCYSALCLHSVLTI